MNEPCHLNPPVILEPGVLVCSLPFSGDLCNAVCFMSPLSPLQTSTSAPLDSTSAAAMLDVTTYMGPTSASVKMDTRGMDCTVCVSNAPSHSHFPRKYRIV